MEIGPIFRSLIHHKSRFWLITVEIALTLAIVANCLNMILDQRSRVVRPTGLDEENHRAVFSALCNLCADRTTFIITHDLQLSVMADLILYMDSGRIVESGTFDQLLRDNGRYAELYRLQTASAQPNTSLERHHALST